MDKKEICVIIPCLNEEDGIKQVILDFKKNVPNSNIHVFDNNSTDKTVSIAKDAGAIVHHVRKRGKGHVIQAMFRDIDADIYILVDGDGTYSAENAKKMLDIFNKNKADIVIGSRIATYRESKSRTNHYFGNRLLTTVVNKLFDTEITDLLSGYRLMSKRYVKTIPLFSQGFEVETAMTIHAIEVGAKILDYPINYLPRAEGSSSKLNTWKDGYRIGKEILKIYKDYAPKMIYFTAATIMIVCGLILGTPVIIDYMETGLVPRFPTAILASAIITIGVLTGFTGVLLSSMAKIRREAKKIAFLTLS